jgi:hypothetical protein
MLKKIAATLAMVTALGTSAVHAAVFEFNLSVPASPDNAPIVAVAHLKVEDVGANTQFTLTKLAVPAFGTGSFLTQLNLAFTGGQVPVTFINVSGQAFESFDETSGSGTDAGYSEWTHEIRWETANNTNRLTDGEFSVFQAANTQATDWVTALAFKQGIVAGSPAMVHIQNVDDFGSVKYVVPEPETYAMLLAGLGLVGFVMRRRVHRLVA